MMQHHFQLKNAALLMALAAAYPLQAHALAGVAQFTAGEVNVRQTDGRTLALAKGGNIDSGQAIVTGGNGRAQVKFTDGGLISLQPNTEFKIANYVDQNDPKEDRFLVDLLRGGMRAITGLIGKRNRDNYKLTTTTATIGIRGSGFKVGYNPDGSLGISSELDKIEVCNQSGCIGLVAGESVKVVDSTTPPVRTSEQPKTETPNTQQDPLVVGNQTGPTGGSILISQPPVPPKPVNTGTFTDLYGVATYYLPLTSGPGSVAGPGVFSPATLDDSKLTSFTYGVDNFVASTTSNAGSVGSVAAGDFVGWGTWATGTKNGSSLGDLSYVVGRPTAVMPTTGTGVAYTLIGQTPVTAYDTSLQAAIGSGTLTSASLTVNFVTSQLTNVAISTTLGGFTVSSGITITGGKFSYINGGPLFMIDGFFTGVNASRAGLVYVGTNGNTRYSGAAAFQAP
jgi:hypothetical protein